MTTTVELRCKRHKHGEFDAEQVSVLVKCRHCSPRAGREIVHEWRVIDLLKAWAKGDVALVCPNEPEANADRAA